MEKFYVGMYFFAGCARMETSTNFEEKRVFSILVSALIKISWFLWSKMENKALLKLNYLN